MLHNEQIKSFVISDDKYANTCDRKDNYIRFSYVKYN